MRTILIMAMFAASVSHAAWYEEVRDLSLNAEGIDSLDIEARAGSLEISGVSGSDTVVAKALIQVDDDEEGARKTIESDLVLSLEKDGDRAVLKGFFEDSGSLFGNDASVRLEVTLPEGMSLSVNDGSGSIDIRDVTGDIEVVDGSGSIEMVHVGGNISIADGSGSISAKEIGGDLTVVDGSGSLSVMQAEGNVTIDDGSGSINISGVAKDLDILESGSGSVNVTDVQGAFNSDE